MGRAKVVEPSSQSLTQIQKDRAIASEFLQANEKTRSEYLSSLKTIIFKETFYESRKESDKELQVLFDEFKESLQEIDRADVAAKKVLSVSSIEHRLAMAELGKRVDDVTQRMKGNRPGLLALQGSLGGRDGQLAEDLDFTNNAIQYYLGDAEFG